MNKLDFRKIAGHQEHPMPLGSRTRNAQEIIEQDSASAKPLDFSNFEGHRTEMPETKPVLSFDQIPGHRREPSAQLSASTPTSAGFGAARDALIGTVKKF